jgi:hypothetical protein
VSAVGWIFRVQGMVQGFEGSRVQGFRAFDLDSQDKVSMDSDSRRGLVVVTGWGSNVLCSLLLIRCRGITQAQTF